MSVALYFNHNAPLPVAHGLRQRGVDVLTAEQDGTTRTTDERLLERATGLGRALVTLDKDFPRIAHRWLESGREFAGVIFAPHGMSNYGQAIAQLEMLAKVYEPDDVRNRIIYFPL